MTFLGLNYISCERGKQFVGKQNWLAAVFRFISDFLRCFAPLTINSLETGKFMKSEVLTDSKFRGVAYKETAFERQRFRLLYYGRVRFESWPTYRLL
jgi:hypothetical protein